MSENNEKSFNISDIGPEFQRIQVHLNKLPDWRRLVTWPINIGLAASGFFLAVLFQIKTNMELPNKSLAFIALLFLGTSIIIGICLRIRFEICYWNDWLNQFTRLSVSLMTKVWEKIEMDANELIEFRKSIAELPNIIGLKKNNILLKRHFKIIILQAISLSLGILLVFLYIIRFLF